MFNCCRFMLLVFFAGPLCIRSIIRGGPEKNRTGHGAESDVYDCLICVIVVPCIGWLGSRVVSVLDSGAQGPGFKSQPRRCRVTVFGKLFALIVPLFTKQRNW